MEESDEPRPRRRIAWLIVAVLVAAFVLYPLSIGPVWVLFVRAGVPIPGFGTIYAPVFWISKRSGTEEELGDYILWWIRVTGTPIQGGS